jgi:hypothetical protein
VTALGISAICSKEVSQCSKKQETRKWLEPPVFPGEEDRNEQARILSAIEHYLFFVLALSAVAVPFLTPTKERNAVLGIILGLLILTGINRILLCGNYPVDQTKIKL